MDIKEDLTLFQLSRLINSVITHVKKKIDDKKINIIINIRKSHMKIKIMQYYNTFLLILENFILN